jgi:hypothetical protein
MKRATTPEQWKEIYRRGHIVFVMRYIKTFLRDYLVLAIVLLVMIKIGVIKAYGVPLMICEGVAFILLGAGLGELQWFLYKERFGIPDDL